MELWISALSEAWGSFGAEDLRLQVEIQSFNLMNLSFVGIGYHNMAFTQTSWIDDTPELFPLGITVM